ncbi:hypothetical protein [Kitasatospora griseola]|uniref:hypothetical protein n=1 Tax=Kitasatospora griseola TaxID=2064 RepID=UPI00381547DE
MIDVVTVVLTGSAAGLLGTLVTGHSAVAGFVTGAVVSGAALVALMRLQYATWGRAGRDQLFENEQDAPKAGATAGPRGPNEAHH